jgi:alkanesulfonate monooxygenase SsuD/methylene tetrahydromethanopterin reductase-like flavin-dependent oxidoreductase (luciferase family)
VIGGQPFERGSVSLRLYPHNELDAKGVVDEMCSQAQLGLESGFDGIMVSEHHGGVGGYLPNPLQLTGFILDDASVGWAAPCPLLLPLRPTAMLAEETAWMAARHPGRVGLGVAAGGRALDFEAMGLDPASAVPRFKEELPRIVDMLRGRDLHGLDGDRALLQCAVQPVPVLSAAISVAAARRAARCGAGILMEGVSSLDRLSACCAAFEAAGGTASKVLIRRVWLGEPLRELIDQQRAFYAAGSRDGRDLPPDQTISESDPATMAERLHMLVRDSGSDALNIRVHLPGIPREAIREQIAGLASDVVPLLRKLLAG